MIEPYSFGNWVMRRRKALNLTRNELAKQVGCATETIKKIEREERRPSSQIAELLANALRLATEEQALFLQVARGERSSDRLPPASPLPQLFPKATHNLPTALTPFIGREKELAAIDKLLADPNCRLLTVVGPGGVGKSRIALRTAENQIAAYRHGVFFVPLAGVELAKAVPAAITNALGLKLLGDVRSQLVQYLRDTQREMLLVLDNFEQLLEAADLLIEMLHHTQPIKFLVTSRERLNVQGEWVFPIEGLPFPNVESTGQLEQYAAVKLFVQTAQRVRPDFVLNAQEKPYVARICQMVEGLPLAIELAASWTRTVTCQEIAHDLEKSIGILTSPMRGIPERHHSIRSVLDHSWKLLPEDEQCVLKKLSVFRRGFTREAAEQVAGASLELLSFLGDKSLLRVDAQPGETQRYNLHELVRQYAHEQLIETGAEELEQVRESHLDYFVWLAEQAEPELLGPNNLIWIARLDQDYDNLRAAFAWATASTRSGSGELSQRLVGALWWFWCLRGHIEEACYWAKCALSQTVPHDAVRAKTLWVSGFLNFFYGNRDLARDLLQQSVALCRLLGPSSSRDLALALNFLGWESRTRGDLTTSQANLEESLTIRRELDDSWGIAQSLMNLGFTASKRGDFAGAQVFFEEGLVAARAWGERSHVAALLNGLGWIVANQGDLRRARSSLLESLEICRELRWEWEAAEAFENLAIVEAWQAGTARLKKAARLWGIAEMLLKTWGSMYRLDESRREIAAAREQLGEEVFTVAWAEGQQMTFDEAVSYAIKG